MTELEKLFTLRNKLVVRRRAIAEHALAASAEQMTGQTFTGIQSAIDAVDRAIADEQASHHQTPAAGASSAVPSARPQESAGSVRPSR